MSVSNQKIPKFIFFVKMENITSIKKSYNFVSTLSL